MKRRSAPSTSSTATTSRRTAASSASRDCSGRRSGCSSASPSCSSSGWAAATSWPGGSTPAPPAPFSAFSPFLGMLIWPMIALGWVVNIFERGAASMGRLNLLLTAAPEIVDRAPADAPADIRGEIEFRNLNFFYNGVPVLTGITLQVPAGSTLAVVGPTGSGKSTLTSLVSGRAALRRPRRRRAGGRPAGERALPRNLAGRHRLRAPGNFPFQRHAARKHRPGGAGGERGSRPRGRRHRRPDRRR